jgi:peptidyl-prolyl cis-trans isomerase SurA
MKKILLLLFVALAFNVSAQQYVMDKIVAVVGDEAILLSDVEQQAALMQKQNGTLPEDAKCMILDQLLVQKILIVRAELDSIQLPEGQVEEQLTARIGQILDYMNGDLQQFNDYYGKSPDEVKEDFREDLENQLLAQRMQQEVMMSVRVTPSEVVSFYSQIPVTELPYFNSEVEVGMIEITPKANAISKKFTRAKLQKLRDAIVAGELDFAEAAKDNSADLGSGRNGGDLGWAKRGKFVPEFEAVAYNLEPNEISEVFETDFGYHILQLLERRGNLIHTRHILLKSKVEDKDFEQTITTLDSLRNLIVTDSISFEYTVIRHTDKNAQTKNTGGLLLNPQTGDPIFEVGDLPPEVYFAVDTMKVGQLSMPIKFENIQSGEVVYKVIKLISRTDPHAANLKDDYHKIQNATLERKKAEHMETWVESQIGEIFINISDDYSSCPGTDAWNGKEKSN